MALLSDFKCYNPVLDIVHTLKATHTSLIFPSTNYQFLKQIDVSFIYSTNHKSLGCTSSVLDNIIIMSIKMSKADPLPTLMNLSDWGGIDLVIYWWNVPPLNPLPYTLEREGKKGLLYIPRRKDI